MSDRIYTPDNSPWQPGGSHTYEVQVYLDGKPTARYTVNACSPKDALYQAAERSDAEYGDDADLAVEITGIDGDPPPSEPA